MEFRERGRAFDVRLSTGRVIERAYLLEDDWLHNRLIVVSAVTGKIHYIHEDWAFEYVSGA